MTLQIIANELSLDRVMQMLKRLFGKFDLFAHWTQGEFHHDLVFVLPEDQVAFDGHVLVVSTNCSGVKDVLNFDSVPERYALWNYRCPENAEFTGQVEPLGFARTEHWFEPCELLVADARSELKAEYRRRQRGGGWEKLE